VIVDSIVRSRMKWFGPEVGGPCKVGEPRHQLLACDLSL
jgi:hypothetical protein